VIVNHINDNLCTLANIHINKINQYFRTSEEYLFVGDNVVFAISQPLTLDHPQMSPDPLVCVQDKKRFPSVASY
jgi:hypothetical protein